MNTIFKNQDIYTSNDLFLIKFFEENWSNKNLIISAEYVDLSKITEAVENVYYYGVLPTGAIASLYSKLTGFVDYSVKNLGLSLNSEKQLFNSVIDFEEVVKGLPNDDPEYYNFNGLKLSLNNDGAYTWEDGEYVDLFPIDENGDFVMMPPMPLPPVSGHYNSETDLFIITDNKGQTAYNVYRGYNLPFDIPPVEIVTLTTVPVLKVLKIKVI